MTVQLSTALISSFALPEATPVTVPMSVLLVVQVSGPKNEGTVTLAPVQRIVPFVVAPILSRLKLPVVSKVGLPSVQLLNDQVENGPPMLVPLKGTTVLPLKVEAVHVLKVTPNVSVSSSEPLTDASRAIEAFLAAPPTSPVVAEAVPANTIEASAAAAASPKILLSFISFSLLSGNDLPAFVRRDRELLHRTNQGSRRFRERYRLAPLSKLQIRLQVRLRRLARCGDPRGARIRVAGRQSLRAG
jgi:hypothetical protein